MTLPFFYTTGNNITADETSSSSRIMLPGPCTINSAPAWGCSSNAVAVQQIPSRARSELCTTARQYEHPVVLVYRNFPNILHWLSDQVVPFFFTLQEFGLADSRVQIVTLDEGHYTHFPPERIALIDRVWEVLSGNKVVSWNGHTNESFCAPAAILGDAGHVLTSYNFHLPLAQVKLDRPRYQAFPAWVLGKYNLSHSAHPRDPQMPTLSMIDRPEGFRRILNQKEMLDIALNLTANARTFHPESLSFEEQLKVVSQTDILIGVHGAGMGLGAFLPPWGVFVELMPYGFGSANRDFYPAFCSWARLMGLQYMGWHNTDRALTRRAGHDPFYLKSYNTIMDLGNATWVVESALELSAIEVADRKTYECIYLNQPALPIHYPVDGD